MTEMDIIRRDGVLYEECDECRPNCDKCSDPVYICIRPKVQTGWICRQCEKPCLTTWMPQAGSEALGCIIKSMHGIVDIAVWEPFYGDVSDVR